MFDYEVCVFCRFFVFRNPFRPWSTTKVWSLVSCEFGLQWYSTSFVTIWSIFGIDILQSPQAFTYLRLVAQALVCRSAKGWLLPFGLLWPCYHCQSRNSLHNLQQGVKASACQTYLLKVQTPKFWINKPCTWRAERWADFMSRCASRFSGNGKTWEWSKFSWVKERLL